MNKTTFFQTISSLKNLFPIHILFLIIYPSLVGVFITCRLLDINEVLINIAWTPVFTILSIFTRKNLFNYLLVFLLFVNGLSNLIHWLLISGPISASSIFVAFNTNLEEVSDFIDLKNSYYLILTIPYFALLYFTVKRLKKENLEPNKTTKILSIVFIVGFLIFITDNLINKSIVRSSIPVFYKSIASFNNELNSYNKTLDENKKSKRNIIASASEIRRKQTFVLIIGESLNRNHLSLYGYNKPTTPKLDLRNDLYVFRNVVCAYNTTLSAVLSALTYYDTESSNSLLQRLSIIDVLKVARFKTFWISNQSPFGAWDNFITIFAKNCDQTRFVNLSGNSSFENTYLPSFDEKVIPQFSKLLQDTTDKKFIVIHLMGSHSRYIKRYPAEFEKYKDFSSEKASKISAYDNSVLYNDYVIDSILNVLKSYSIANNISSSLIYFSDHGENVYDQYDYAGHDYADKLSKHIVEVPFIAWFSPNYKENYKSKLDSISIKFNSPYSTENLFHSILDLLEIKTNYFEKNRSLFNADYNENRKRIINGSIDYDTL